MSYTRPDGDACDFDFTGDAYTRPDGDAADFDFLPDSFTGVGAVTIEITAAGVGAAAPEIVGEGAVDLGLSAAGAGAHGVAGTGAATIGLSAAGAGVHHRYELKGEVRDAGVLVNRRVRAYRRDTGALVAEADTVAGRFTLPVGFEAREHYVVPIHLDAGAEDWSPPTANRVLSVLAED